jgi:hypothetical protein
VLCQAQQEFDDAKEVFDLLNDQLITELPQLLDLRVPYFDPSFEAMIRMQCKFAEEGYEKMSGVQRCVPRLLMTRSVVWLTRMGMQILRRQRARRLRSGSIGLPGRRRFAGDAGAFNLRRKLRATQICSCTCNTYFVS